MKADAGDEEDQQTLEQATSGVDAEGGGEDLAEAPTGLQMSLEEMAAATGVDRDRIKELEQFGIVCIHGPEGGRYYDGDDYVTLSIVKDFLRFGIEPRHLTMYKHFADRESAFFEALVAPTLRQKNPDARRAATQTLGRAHDHVAEVQAGAAAQRACATTSPRGDLRSACALAAVASALLLAAVAINAGAAERPSRRRRRPPCRRTGARRRSRRPSPRRTTRRSRRRSMRGPRSWPTPTPARSSTRRTRGRAGRSPRSRS